MVEVETDEDDGDDDEGGGAFPVFDPFPVGGIDPLPVGRIDPEVGRDPDGGVVIGGGGRTPTDDGGGRITAAGAVGAVKLLSGISGA